MGKIVQKIIASLLLFTSLLGMSQVYPVQMTPVFHVPYSSRLSDYANSMDVRMRLLVNTTDIGINNRQVRLKMYVQGNGIQAQSSEVVVGMNPIYINGGELLTLTNLELAPLFRLENLEGMSPSQYANALPEGLYTVCFELYDFLTNQKISQKSCAQLYLMLNDPPLLNTPSRNESIAVSDFPNILFTWTPRQINATNVSYQFELKEILDPTIDPQIGFLTSPLLYEEELRSTALLYDVSKPNLLPGKRYAWRVRAMSTSGLSLNNVFKNEGYSEIYHFTYASHCPAPTFILSEAVSARSVRVSWLGDKSHTKYHVQYRKSNVAGAEWFEVYTMNTQTTLSDLEAGVNYEFRVGGSCEPAVLGNTATFTYSGINQFSMPATGTATTSFTCGLNPTIAIANQTPITNLIVSETFTAGDFPVKILELTGNNPYNGKGYIIVPYLADTKIAVAFNNITVNTNYQLIKGVVETTYNPEAPNISDVEDLSGGNNGQIVTQTVPFVITTITTNPNGDIIVGGANGEQITIPGGSNTVITGGNGQIYNVDSQGNATGPFVPAPGVLLLRKILMESLQMDKHLSLLLKGLVCVLNLSVAQNMLGIPLLLPPLVILKRNMLKWVVTICPTRLL
ncbi:fibronectin type III domain-containing protein [Flavobacterium davisii]|uniref:Fibronectin type III domain-containing protein n=1 Tax=Flavobacterium columnare TaxID=996 RepID=A0A8G0P6Y8_9FLAO|nr:fibronectin type III domain-containing protein [Flavobacterium davisii]QYS89612.1 fibronectin type III domain-containing protein [Flavobacterium davisii]